VAGYRITSKLGEGAMGVVYRGEHTVLGRPAAIKFLNADLAENEELVSRFFTEARAVNGIRHPNIVDITDFGQRGNRHYYVMEFLDGQTLLDRLMLEGRTDLASTIRIGTQVAAALAAAHDKGIVHRDLKPENIYVCNHPDYPDYVKVFDFGIAKLIEKSPADTHQTRAGYVLGTPLYMSPEQCTGEESLDHRSDVYSLGIVLYQMITGVVPFNAPTMAGIVKGHISEQPTPPRMHNNSIPPELEELILLALAKDPDDRIPDMRTMRSMLEACDPDGALVELTPIADEQTPVSSGRRYRSRPSAPPPVDDRAADKLVDELITIILERIENDRLVLPAMPASAMRAIRELDNPNVTFRAISKIIGDDPVLAPQLYRLASTAQYGNAERPRTIEQAISRLGMGTLKSTLIELSAHQVYDSRNRKIRKSFKGIWDHTVAVATAARLVAENLEGPVDPHTAHLAGLMHDVGKPIVGALLLEAEKMLGMKKKDWITQEAWTAVVEQSHRKVGTALARKWELPNDIVGVIADSNDYSDDEDDTCANIVRFANAFAKRCGKSCGEFDEDEIEDIVIRGVDKLGLDWVFVHSTLQKAIANAGDTNAEGASSTQALAK
tara:strand:- start:6156 stop:7982 length:1827 start_codon:yes stop_codon:yes gene_type:complete